MPRTKKGIGKKTSGHPTGRRQKPPAPITIRSMISAETRDKSRTQEETSRTTKTATKRQSAIVPTHHGGAKCQRAVKTTWKKLMAPR